MKPLLFLVAAIPILLFAGCREEMIAEVHRIMGAAADPLLDELAQRGEVERRGTDAECRPLFVSLQGAFEQAMANAFQSGRIAYLRGAIHTPMPATPCCTAGEISEGLVDPNVAIDPDRLQTIEMRAAIVRRYLDTGAPLHIVYPADGFWGRSSEQRRVYRALLGHYANLLDHPTDRREIEPELIGATYLFFADGATYLFSIQASQANAPSDETSWKIWFTSVDRAHDRWREVATLVDF